MKRVAIMTSGGLDSYIAYYYAKKHGLEPVPIWINLGQPYAKKEEKAIDSFEFRVRKITCDVLREEFGNKPTVDNWIIPGRNLLLALIGAMFADRVWITALDGEMHKYAKERDKSPEFFHLTSGLFTYVFDVIRPETIVETPFKHMSKTEIVEWAITNGISEEQLLRTSSCYHEKLRNCGLCGTCFKRWIAMTNNGIKEEYANPPWKCDYARKTVKEMLEASKKKDYSHYSKKRQEETFRALKIAGVKYEDIFGGG